MNYSFFGNIIPARIVISQEKGNGPVEIQTTTPFAVCFLQIAPRETTPATHRAAIDSPLKIL